MSVSTTTSRCVGSSSASAASRSRAAWSRGKAGTLYGYYWCRVCRPRMRVSKRDLEAAFIERLAHLQPKPEYMKLFRAVVLDVWNKRTAVAREERERLQQRVGAVRGK